MPEINKWSTCDVCNEVREQVVYFEFRDGLYFEICKPCLEAAQQIFAPDPPLALVCECGSLYGVHKEFCPKYKSAVR